MIILKQKNVGKAKLDDKRSYPRGSEVANENTLKALNFESNLVGLKLFPTRVI